MKLSSRLIILSSLNHCIVVLVAVAASKLLALPHGKSRRLRQVVHEIISLLCYWLLYCAFSNSLSLEGSILVLSFLNVCT